MKFVFLEAQRCPAQWTVEPPTDFTIHAGRLGKSPATRQSPDVVRISVHASCVKLSHSLLMKFSSSVRGPASRITALTPFLREFVAKRSATRAGTDNDDHTVVVQIELCHVRFLSTVYWPSEDLRQPVDIAEAAVDVAAVFGRRAFVTELRPELLLVIKRDDEIGPDLLEEVALLDSLAEARCGRPPRAR